MPILTHKRSKASVEFEHPAKGPHHCSQCVYFMPNVEACRRVIGHITKRDWCKLFEPKS